MTTSVLADAAVGRPSGGRPAGRRAHNRDLHHPL